MHATPMIRICGLIAIVMGTFVIPGRVAAADTSRYHRYRVKAGDTPELLAAEYYGSRRFAPIILAANGLLSKPKAELKRGKRVRIPRIRHIVLSPGASVQSVAKTYLGDEKWAGLLAEFNGLEVDARAAIATIVEVPLQFSHVPDKASSFVRVLASLGVSSTTQRERLAKKLRVFNELSSDALAPGVSVVIPGLWIRSPFAPHLTRDERALLAKAKRSTVVAHRALVQAKQDWKLGNYGAIIQALTPVWKKRGFLDKDIFLEIGTLLASCLLADAKTSTAVVVFSLMHKAYPKYRLSRFTHSPTVRAAFDKAAASPASLEQDAP